MSVFGLDLSLTSTGMVVLSNSGELLYNGTIGYPLKKPKVWDHQERIATIVNKIEDVFSEYSSKYIVLEDYAYNKMQAGSRSFSGLAELTGVVKFLFYEWGIEPLVIPATQARKLVFEGPVSIKSSERKEGIKIKDKLRILVRDAFEIEFATSDEIDAFILAEAVRQFLDGGALEPDKLESFRKVTGKRKGSNGK